MALLPRFLVLKSGGKYLTIPENLDERLPSGFLKFDEEQIWSPRVKFAVEQAETGDGRFVHIRSCYNNKYWVADPIQQLLWIVAAGDKPEEDQSNDKCTLFEPDTSSGNATVRLGHVQTGKSLITPGSSVPSWMFQGVEASTSITGGTPFDVIDWETLVILPSQISFRSIETNGYYLCSCNYGDQCLRPGLDLGDPRVVKVLYPTPDGNYRIMDACNRKFWSGRNYYIRADAEDNNSDNNTIFSIVKISDNVIALRCLGNNRFCGADAQQQHLCTGYDIMSRETRLMVEECVLQREISDVRYRLLESRIYQEEVQEIQHAFATNGSQDHESKVTLNYTTVDSSTTHWTNSESFKFDVNVKFTAAIPFIDSAELKISEEYDYFTEWKVTKKTERTREASYTVVVPPLKTIKVTLVCTKGNCDVPFSYIQRDLLATGERVTTLKHDGIYNGHNSYNFRFHSEVTDNSQGRTFI